MGKSVCLGRRRDGRVRQRLGWVGVLGYASGFFEPVASHLPASPSPRNEGLLGQAPSRSASV